MSEDTGAGDATPSKSQTKNIEIFHTRLSMIFTIMKIYKNPETSHASYLHKLYNLMKYLREIYPICEVGESGLSGEYGVIVESVDCTESMGKLCLKIG